MQDESAHIAGELLNWPTKQELARLLRQADLDVYVGRYSVRIRGFSHFVFQEYGGDLGDPQIDADAPTVEQMIREGEVVSNVFASAGVVHRLEVYNDAGDMVAYLHHGWPLDETPPGTGSF